MPQGVVSPLDAADAMLAKYAPKAAAPSPLDAADAMLAKYKYVAPDKASADPNRSLLSPFAAKDPAYAPSTPVERDQFTEKLMNLVHTMASAQHPVAIVSRGRNADQQAALFAKGPQTTQMDGRTKLSQHQLDLAADLAFKVNGQPSFDNQLPWQQLGDAAKAQGLVWGGDWQSPKDHTHVQLRPISTMAPEKGVK